jgi:hypothetical protein
MRRILFVFIERGGQILLTASVAGLPDMVKASALE